MKKGLAVAVALVTFVVLLVACFSSQPSEQFLRIHIRANSNLECDQTVKYEVKQQVVDFLTPYIAQCNGFNDVKETLTQLLENIEQVANQVLASKGFNYTSKAKLNNEFFPTRAYGSLVLEANYYDALILELGNASGDNWWCVVYPPLCFVGGEGSGTNITYKSKIQEIIQHFFNQ